MRLISRGLIAWNTLYVVVEPPPPPPEVPEPFGVDVLEVGDVVDELLMTVELLTLLLPMLSEKQPS